MIWSTKVTPHRKQALLSMIAQVEGCEMRQTIAVGDGFMMLVFRVVFGLFLVCFEFGCFWVALNLLVFGLL